MLTLTLASTDRPLRDEIKRLTTCFRKLRAKRTWKHHFRGGVWCVEVTINKATGQWHPHAHALIDGTYVAQAELSSLWHEITGDSRVVDIRVVHSRTDAVRYVSKYVGKAADTRKIPTNRVAEYADALSGLRLVQPFGNCHGVKAAQPDPEEPAETTQVLEFAAAMHAADADDTRAAELYAEAIDLAERFQRPVSDEQAPALSARVAALVTALWHWKCDREGIDLARAPADHTRPPPPQLPWLP
jgi:hypothetical protein